MNNDDRNRDRQPGFRTWRWVILVLMALVVLVSVLTLIGRNSVKRRLAALRAAGYPTNFTELAEYHKLPEGTPNAADVYERAFAAFVEPASVTNIPQYGTAALPERGSPPPEPMVKAIAQWLAENQQCLALLHEAAGIEHCRYDCDYRQGPPYGKEVKSCAYLLSAGTLVHAHAGDANAVVTCIKDGLRLANSLQNEPALVSHLMATACHALAIAGFERSLSLTRFTDRQLAELGDALADIAGTLDLTPALVGERCFMIEACRRPSLVSVRRGIDVLIQLPGVRQRGLMDALDYMEDCLTAIQQPEAERQAAFQEAEKKVRELSILHPMIKIMAPALNRVVVLDLRFRATLDRARAAVAIERYRLATGRLPDQLEGLVPKLLERVPSDPFDGQPLRYRRTDPGYILYSVGEDGHDDGGRERDPKNPTAPYDWPFIVRR